MQRQGNNEGPWVPETGLFMTASFIEEINNLYKFSREVHTLYQSACNMDTAQYVEALSFACSPVAILPSFM